MSALLPDDIVITFIMKREKHSLLREKVSREKRSMFHWMAEAINLFYQTLFSLVPLLKTYVGVVGDRRSLIGHS